MHAERSSAERSQGLEHAPLLVRGVESPLPTTLTAATARWRSPRVLSAVAATLALSAAVGIFRGAPSSSAPAADALATATADVASSANASLLPPPLLDTAANGTEDNATLAMLDPQNIGDSASTNGTQDNATLAMLDPQNIGDSASATNATNATDDVPAQPNPYTGPWKIYKHAIPIADGSHELVATLVNATIAPVTSDDCLGCDAHKIVATLAGGVELHFVDMPRGSETWDATWLEYFSELNGNMTEFNAFMHNKVQLFVGEIGPYLDALDRARVPYMRRRSTMKNGTAETDVLVAHAAVSIAGRVYELVSPVDGADASASVHARVKAWPQWAANECPPAHQLHTRTLEEYGKWYMERLASVTDEAIDDYVTSWESESSRLAPMLVQLTVASEDADARTKALASMHGYTGLSVVDRQATPQCVVNTLSFDTTRAQPNVKYVTNAAAREGSRTVAAYDAHVGSFHERFVSDSPIWAHWDRYLDHHLGFEYEAPTYDACKNVTEVVSGTLAHNGVPVAMRTASSLHYYTGYSSSLAWEFNIVGCDVGSVNGNADLCGCDWRNNDLLFETRTGRTECTPCKDFSEAKQKKR